MIRIISKREKLILYLTLGVFIFSLGFNLFFGPVIAKNESLNKEIMLTRSKLNKYLWLLDEKDNIQNEYDRLSGSNGPRETAENSSLSALTEIENIAKSTNVSIIDIRPQGPKESGGSRERTIDLRLEATMENQFNFIYKLENSALLLRIKSFQLTAKSNSDLIEGTYQLSQLET